MKSHSLFRNLQERESIGLKSKKLFDVCYVAVTPIHASLSVKDTKEFFSGKCDAYATLYDLKAFDREIDAENEMHKSLKRNFVSGYGSALLRDEYLNYLETFLATYKCIPQDLKPYEVEEKIKELQFTPNDLVNNAYWIFTVKGKAEEITALLSKDNWRHGIGFGVRIICAASNDGTLITRNQLEAEEEKKLQPGVGNR